MRRSVRLAAYVAAPLLMSAVTVFAFSPVAEAATLTVTTATDSVNGGDGLLSLREAITEANSAVEPTTIVLAAATTYQLDLGCALADEDGNASGDLDHTGDQDLTIEGNGATIEQTCANRRVLHTIHIAPTVTLNELTLTGGSGEGAAVHFSNDLVITGSTITGNDSPTGTLREPGMVTASLTLTDSTVGPNTGRGIGGSFQANVTITGSTITENTEAGVDLTDGHLTVSDSTVTDNGGDGLRTTGQGSGLLTVTNTVVSGNGGTGIVCSNCGDLDLTGSTVADNDDGGLLVTLDQDTATSDITISINTSSVLENNRDGAGAGLRVTESFVAGDAPLAQILVQRSTFAGNEASGIQGTGGAIFAEHSEVHLTNSTLTTNEASVEGGAIHAVDGVHLTHATIVENEAPAGSQIFTDAGLTSFGSIVAAGSGGDECDVAGGTTSGGYNVGGDGTCAFTGTGDQNTAGAVHLGPLVANGGPTRTRLPLANSPALGAVPASACTISTVDQRGVARPQGADCEAGAVEIGDLAGTGSSLTGVLIVGGALVLAGGLVLGMLAIRRRRPSR